MMAFHKSRNMWRATNVFEISSLYFLLALRISQRYVIRKYMIVTITLRRIIIGVTAALQHKRRADECTICTTQLC